MVSLSVITAVCITLFVSLILPIIVYIIYGVTHKGKGVWTAWLLGAAGFFVLQILIRMPLLSLLSNTPLFQPHTTGQAILYMLFLAFTAGLFEVAGRYAVAKILSKKLTFERAFAAGLGHGGIEAIVIVGLTYINNLVYIIMINTGSFDSMIEQTAALGVSTDSLENVRAVLVSSTPFMYYCAGYERILTMVFHVALSLLVCYFVWKKQDVKGIFICLGLHTIVDFVVPLINLTVPAPWRGKIQPVIFVYLFLTITAVLSLIYILRLRTKWRKEKAEN